MKVLRIKLRQNQASYAREETTTNRMTYPLPPFSTVIGALHNACGYTTYHPMEVSVQGRFGSMQREIYVNHNLLNSTQDDRNQLVYLPNQDLLSGGHILVGEGLKAQGNSFANNQTVRIDHGIGYEKYRSLHQKRRELDEERKAVREQVKLLKDQEKQIRDKLKELDKKSPEYEARKEEADELRLIHKTLDANMKERYRAEYEEPYAHFRTLVKAPKYQEVLYEVELVLHIKAEAEILQDIQDHIDDFVCLGRSEDFIELQEVQLVDIGPIKGDARLKDDYKMYVNVDRATLDNKDRSFYFVETGTKWARGTVYYLNKDYTILDGQRVFNRIPCIYSSHFGADQESDEAFIDEDGYLVDLN